MHKWFLSHEIMYNETVKYINKLRFNKEKIKYNWRLFRTQLKHVKKDIINKSNINTHVLDEAIKLAVCSYKSAFTNFRNGNIKRFRVRYIKHKKPKKVLHIEKRFISRNKNTFCSRIFKKNIRCENNYQLKNITKDFKIHYNKYTNRYLFLVPITKNPSKIHNKRNTIGPRYTHIYDWIFW